MGVLLWSKNILKEGKFFPVLNFSIPLIPNYPYMAESKKSLCLRDIPEDIKKFLIKTQCQIKVEKGISQFSLENTIYKLIRESPKFKQAS